MRAALLVVINLIIFLGINFQVSAEPMGRVIDSVVIDNREIFDLDSVRSNVWLYRLANKLHLKTHKSVIGRELLMRPGDTFSSVLAEESARNLRNLPFIYHARVDLDSSSGSNILRVTTSDRWTLVAGPSLTRSSGQTTYRLGIEELNLLGYGQQVRFDYFIREFDQNFGEVTYYDRRIMGWPYSLNIYHNGNPEIGWTSATFSQPFYSLSDRFGYSVTFININREDRYFHNGSAFAWNDYKGRTGAISGSFRIGDYYSKVSVSLTWQYTDIDISRRRYIPDIAYVVFPADSIYHTLVGSFGIHQTRFVKLKRINNFRKVEDFELTSGLSLSLGHNINAVKATSLYRTFSFSGILAEYFHTHLLYASFSRSYWYANGHDIRTTFQAACKYYYHGWDFLTIVVLGAYSEDKRRLPQEALLIGEENGLRGYPRYYLSGERLIRLNWENRVFTGIEVLSAEIGVVQFVDAAQAVTGAETFADYKWAWSIGAGLRIAPEKISNADIIRLDLAWAEKLGRWQISLGIGQYF